METSWPSDTPFKYDNVKIGDNKNRGHPGGRHGRSYLPKLSHFSLFQARIEVVLHRINRKKISKDYHFSITENGQNFSLFYPWKLNVFVILLMFSIIVMRQIFPETHVTNHAKHLVLFWHSKIYKKNCLYNVRFFNCL